MAIIYSYTKTNEAYGSDLLVLSRFQGSANADNGRNYSIDLGTLGAFIVENYASDLNSVLTAGNTSLLDAKVGSIYLYNSFAPATLGYVSITGDKNAFNFFSVQGTKYAQIYNGGIFLKGIDTTFGTNIQAPNPASTTSVATFQDASGTIAYLSDITALSNYGLATQLANSTPIANTTTKSTLNGSSYAGTLSVPANGFSVGDSFNLYMMGHISNNNNVGLTITIETVAGVVLATTGLMTLAVSSNNHWVLDADYVIRAIGTTGTASIITAGSFAHSKASNNNLETYNFINENTTTFNTTIANELVIKAQWGTASAGNFIYSNVFILNKVY